MLHAFKIVKQCVEYLDCPSQLQLFQQLFSARLLGIDESIKHFAAFGGIRNDYVIMYLWKTKFVALMTFSSTQLAYLIPGLQRMEFATTPFQGNQGRGKPWRGSLVHSQLRELSGLFSKPQEGLTNHCFQPTSKGLQPRSNGLQPNY